MKKSSKANFATATYYIFKIKPFDDLTQSNIGCVLMAHHHLALSPIVINLKELPQNGRSFSYNQVSGELTPILREIIGSNPYKVDVEIKPMGNIYKMTGHIETGLNEICSLCALEFVQPIRQSFQEILILHPKRTHEGHTSRVHHSSELDIEGPECTELESEDFNVAEFIRELIAVARPMKPLARPDCDEKCVNYQEAIKKGWLTTADNETKFKRSNPFEILQKVKLNS